MSPLGRFAPPVVLMGVIFGLSSTPDLNSGLGTIDLVARKFVHMAEFGLMWWLWWRAFGYDRPWAAAAITLGYAASDEWHQSFVGGRNASPLDWGFDAVGVAAAWGLARSRWSSRLRRECRPNRA
jgi:hypothetical protein